MQRGAVWLGLTRVSVNLIGLVSTLLLARLLTPEDFGLVAIATSIIAVINSLTEMSLTAAIVQHPDPDDSHYHTAFTLNVLRATLIGSVICGSSFLVADLYGDQRLVAMMIVIGVSTFVGSLASPRLVNLTRNLIFWQDFANNVSQKVLAFAVSVAIAVVFRSYWALIAGSVVAQLSGVLFSYLVAPYRPRFMLTQWRGLLSFSGWITISEVINTINWRLDQAFIGYLIGRRELGLYSFGENLAALPTREVTAPVTQTLFPTFTHLAHDIARLRRAYTLAQSTLSILAVPTGVGFALLAEPIVRLAIGEKWLSAVPVIQILSITFAFQTLGNPVQQLALALGETKRLMIRDATYLFIRMPIVLVGLWLGGLPGVLIGRFISSLLGTLNNMLLVERLIGSGIGAQLRANGRTFVAVAAMAGAAIGAQAMIHRAGGLPIPVTIGLVVIVAAAFYFAVLFGLWIVARRPEAAEGELLKMADAMLLKASSLMGRQSSAG